MTPVLTAVYDELLSFATRPPFAERSRLLREHFFERCGRYAPDHGAAGPRDAAAWEFALVRLAGELAPLLKDTSERELAQAIPRAQYGVYAFELSGEELVARDLWSGAELIVLSKDDVGREICAARRLVESPICQGRLLASRAGCAFLPGVVFHPSDARQALKAVLASAHHRGLASQSVLDALLRMEHTFHTLSRVKLSYAYRAEALPEA